MKFPCTSCGACCHRVGLIEPSMALENGRCINLNEDNSCNIYNDRPDFCRIDYSKSFPGKALFRDEAHYIFVNAVLCNKMMEQDGIDKSFKINLGA